MRVIAICIVFTIMALGSPAIADVTIETVAVGNAGNAADSTGYGRVNYAYNIGKYEVTAGQYTEFLNAVAATDAHGLYCIDMAYGWNGYGCRINRSGASGSYTYSVAAEWANRPVNYVSWGSAARFANWLHNGQPTGAQDLTTTEDGAYYMNGVTGDAALLAIRREADWKWAITNENEWYKAAYHKNDGVTGNYWDYPTCSDTPTSKDLISPDPGNNATFWDNGYTIGNPYYRTVIGEHENSESPYGTFDQGGNISEWNETIYYELFRGVRGGSFYTVSDIWLSSSEWYFDNPSTHYYDEGFRVVASIPAILLEGDANRDGVVSAGDYAAVQANFGNTGDAGILGDASGDGVVSAGDYASVQANFGNTASAMTPVPEPATLLLLASFGLVAMIKRRT